MNAPFGLDASVAAAPLRLDHAPAEADLAAFLGTAPGASPFHSAAWGQAIAAATGHRWHLLGVRRNGALVGILPLHAIRSRLFGSVLASTGFAVDGGILATDPAAVPILADAAIALAGETGLSGVELRGGSMPSSWAADTATYLGFVRPLAEDADAQLAAIPRKHRAEVRKALASDLTVHIGTGDADRDAHFRVYAASVRNLGTPVFPRRLFDAVLDAFGDAADILTIRHQGEPVASVLSLYWQGRVMPYWGGGTRAARALRANERMYVALMEHARQRGMTRFDFGRSKAGSGPAAYKKNWGFEPVPLAYARWSASGDSVRDTNPTSPRYQLMVSTWRKMPLWLANRLGPIIARQLG